MGAASGGGGHATAAARRRHGPDGAALGLVNVDLPWLWTARRLGRGGLTRVVVTVRAVGVPSARRLVLSTQSLAWTAERGGVLHGAVVGDVLVADLDPRDGTWAVLTLGRERSLATTMATLSPGRYCDPAVLAPDGDARAGPRADTHAEVLPPRR